MVAAKRRLLGSIWRHIPESVGCLCLMLGNIIFMHSDDYRVDLRRIEAVASPDPVARQFEQRTAGYI